MRPSTIAAAAPAPSSVIGIQLPSSGVRARRGPLV
jgi:hypothetical protein